MFKTTYRSFSAPAVAALMLAVCTATLVDAAPINYGDFSAGFTMYLDVTEDSGTDDPPLYNAPTISGNLLDFDTSGFVSTTTGGPLDITDGQLNFTVRPPAGLGIASLAITESGDFAFEGTGGAGTTVRASLVVDIDILEVNGVPLASPIQVGAIDTYATDLATEGVGPGAWSNGVLIDFGPLLGPDELVTKAEVVVDNQLITNSELDSLAFIAKKDFAVTPGEDPTPFVPEPASLALAALGAVALLGSRRSA